MGVFKWHVHGWTLRTDRGSAGVSRLFGQLCSGAVAAAVWWLSLHSWRVNLRSVNMFLGEEVYLHIFARNLYHVGRQELVCVGADGSPLCSWNKKEKTHVGRQHK